MLRTHPRIEHILTSRTLDRVLDPRKTKRINPQRRVRRVLIDVDPARQPDRVFTYESTTVRIVVAMPVIVQPRLGIMILGLASIETLECSLKLCDKLGSLDTDPFDRL